jgi:hypothetical protein
MHPPVDHAFIIAVAKQRPGLVVEIEAPDDPVWILEELPEDVFVLLKLVEGSMEFEVAIGRTGIDQSLGHRSAPHSSMMA